MNLSIQRLLVGSIAVVVVAFVTAGLSGNHQEGVRGVVGDVAWMVFMFRLLIVVGLAVAMIAQRVLRRRRATKAD